MQRTIVRMGLVGAAVLAGLSGALTAQAAQPAQTAAHPASTVLTAMPHETALPTRHAAQPDVSSGPRFTSGAEYRVTAGTLNVRSGPGTSYRVVDSLGVGHVVFVRVMRGGWSEIGPNEWVSSDFLSRSGVVNSGNHRVHYVYYVPSGHHYKPGKPTGNGSYAIVNKGWAADFKPGDAVVYVAVQDIPIFNGSQSTVGTEIIGHTRVGSHYLGSIGVQETPSGDYRYLGSGHWVGAEALVPVNKHKHARKPAVATHKHLTTQHPTAQHTTAPHTPVHAGAHGKAPAKA